jgi:NAD(P)-dependent dehydrogenase (short-subunit alcohol dehydrogenase family)
MAAMSKVVFITGISSGFGKYTSSFLAQKGYKVYGTCRKACEHDPLVHALQMDITDLSAVEKNIKLVLEKEGRIDVLINNAGMHTGGALEVLPYEDIKLQMETNFMGAVYTIRNVLPAMRKQNKGTIVNISSIGGLMGLPFQGYYSASKFAMEGFSEALRMELKEFNINVVVINPGDFHTNNTINRRNVSKSDTINAYVAQFTKTLSIIEYDENNGWKPEILARKLYGILEKKKPANRYIIASFEQKLAIILKRILPDKWFEAILQGHYGIK